MCFHVSLTKSKGDIEKKSKMIFKYPDAFESYYHFNAWETKNLVIVKQEEPKLLELASWGLLPTMFDISNRKDFLIKTNTLNATKERLFESNLYSQFIETQRCLIFADGLFEPHSVLGEKRKKPYYFKEKNHELFAFAGMYSLINDESEKQTYSATIITTEANAMFKEIHNKPNKLGSYRMPLILDPSNYRDWLNANNKNKIENLLDTFTSQELIAYPVSQNLFSNKINTNIPSIIQEVPTQSSLF